MPLKNDMLLPQTVQAYLLEHRFDDTVANALNDVIKLMPEDPLGYVADVLSKSVTSPPSLAAPRLDLSAHPLSLTFELTAIIQGMRVRVGMVSLGEKLFVEPQEEGAEREEGVGEQCLGFKVQPQTPQWWQLAEYVRDVFLGFDGVSVHELATFHERCVGLAQTPPLGERALDPPRAISFLVEELMTACARSLGSTTLDFVQGAMTNSVIKGDMDQADVSVASPPLRTRGDITAWRGQWPRIAVPAFCGGGPGCLRATSLRVCCAFSAFVKGDLASIEKDAPEGCPTFGWVNDAAQTAISSVGEAVKVLQADKTTVAMVVDGVAYAHPSGLVQTVRLARQAAEAAAGASGAGETSGVLLAAAEEAWLEEECVYEVETGKKMSLEELVDLYVQVTEDEWVRYIARPFRPEDMVEGCRRLREQRPEVRLVADSAPGEGLPVPPTIERGAPPEAFGCAATLEAPASLAVSCFIDNWPAWRANADGFGRLLHVDSRTLKLMPSAVEVALAYTHAEVICLASDVTEASQLAPAARRVSNLLAAVVAREDPAD